ncbi:MAG: type II toxin-antitoxin system VapB family antitoxin [Campylobacterota bacterium]|nr:type II toxin-antitoxin system VapB family antitoxin [Campylobacterota bacterium]
MRTNIVIDEQLMQEAFRYSSLKTKKEIINLALQEFVENAKKLSLLDLKGKISFEESYDYKDLRATNVSS